MESLKYNLACGQSMNLSRGLILVVALALESTAGAVTVNIHQPITVESDSAERDEKTGLTKYLGNVLIRQGSVVIEADQVSIHYTDNAVSRVLCSGAPASYQQLDQSGESVLARAGTIEYLPREALINLKTDASLSHRGTLIKGDSINFDLRRETWKANSDNQSTQKRIQLVIPPPQSKLPTEEIDGQ
jgi:lipopolysaccharide export system protein LptA